MKTILLSIITFTLTSLLAIADVAPPDVTPTLKTLLDATQNNDIEKFQSVCDADMSKAVTADVLKQVSTQVSPLMQGGYKSVYLGVLDRAAFKTYYWKIDYDKDGAPDMLAELSMSKGKVAGFFIR